MFTYLSIIIPIYNAAKYLPNTFKNLPLQDDFEVILVDDGSTDNSLQVCQEYANTRTNVKVFTQVNGGPSKARNLGLKHACGEYITFLDADDGYSVGALEKACGYLKENPVDVLFQKIQRISMDGRSHFILDYQDNVVLDHEVLRTLWCRNDALIKGFLWAKIYRWNLLEGITFPEDMWFTEDMYSLSDIFMKVKTACMFSEGAYVYYERENTLTSNGWNIEKSRQTLKTYLHRWECSISGNFPEKDQIAAWYSALRFFITERKAFPGEDWKMEYSKLKENEYSLLSCLVSISGFRKKIGFLKRLIEL